MCCSLKNCIKLQFLIKKLEKCHDKMIKFQIYFNQNDIYFYKICIM